jgi:hypothetical protein
LVVSRAAKSVAEKADLLGSHSVESLVVTTVHLMVARLESSSVGAMVDYSVAKKGKMSAVKLAVGTAVQLVERKVVG